MLSQRTLLATALILATSTIQAQQDEVRLRIVTTTTQATDLVTVLTQDAKGLQITPLMGAGVDPHLYQPTEADIRAISEADMLVYSGLHLEGQFDAVFRALSERGVAIYASSEPVKQAGFVLREYDETTGSFGAEDPHFWFDPRNWELTALDLAEALARLDPHQAESYRANAEAYAQQLQALFEWASQAMSSVPEAQRTLITSHDAFQYFAAAFDWHVSAIQGISTQDEAGVGDIQAITNLVIEQQIPVLFVESSVAPSTIRAVIEAAASRGAKVRLGLRELYSDAMGEPGTFGGTYIGMTAANILTILQSYTCADVPVNIPAWPAELPELPEDLLDVDCAA